jgi:hypothetical protein
VAQNNGRQGGGKRTKLMPRSTAEGRPTFPNVLGVIFRLREARRNEIRFAADPFTAKTTKRLAS